MRTVAFNVFYSCQKLYKEFSAVFTSISIYWVSSFFSKSISFFLFPLMLQKLTPEEMGLISLFTSFIGIISMIMGLGLRQACMLEFCHKPSAERRAILNDIIGSYLIISGLIILFLVSQFWRFNYYFFANKATIIMLVISLTHCFIAFFTEFVNQICICRQQTHLLLWLQISGSCLTALVIMCSLYFWQAGVIGILFANIAGVSVTLFVGCYWYYKNALMRSWDWSRLYTNFFNYVRTGLPFLPSLLATWLLSSTNRWMLASYSSLYNVGIYSLVETASSVFYLFVIHPLTIVYVPSMFEKFTQNKEQIQEVDLYNKKVMSFSIILLFCLTTAGYFVLRPFLFFLVPDCYKPAIPLILIMLVGNIFSMGVCFLNCYSQYLKKSLFLTGSLVTTLIINIFLCVILIPRYSLLGAVIALMSSYLIYFLMALFYNSYLHKKANLYSS